MKTTSFLFLVLLGSAAIAQAQTSSGTSTMTFTFDSRQGDSVYTHGPDWDATGDPPLSCGEAIKAAREFLAKHGIQNATVIGITLFPKEPLSKRWAYSLLFLKPGHHATDLLVAMNGTVFPPSSWSR